jgi:fatty acid desaturase
VTFVLALCRFCSPQLTPSRSLPVSPLINLDVHNHHKHDNSLEDVITVIDFARDDMLGYVGYLWRYLSYTLNVSSAISFWNSGDVARCAKISLCTLCYLGFCLASARLFGAAFCLAYVIYPMAQGVVIMAAINYTWHAFVHPGDEQNKLVNSTTIVNGEYFILKEEYHAVHHLYAGVHWTKHEAMYERHKDDCKVPTRFYGLSVFELWAMIVLRDYAGLAANSGIDEQVLVARLRHTVQRELAPSAAVVPRPA